MTYAPIVAIRLIPSLTPRVPNDAPASPNLFGPDTDGLRSPTASTNFSSASSVLSPFLHGSPSISTVSTSTIASSLSDLQMACILRPLSHTHLTAVSKSRSPNVSMHSSMPMMAGFSPYSLLILSTLIFPTCVLQTSCTESLSNISLDATS